MNSEYELDTEELEREMFQSISRAATSLPELPSETEELYRNDFLRVFERAANDFIMNYFILYDNGVESEICSVRDDIEEIQNRIQNAEKDMTTKELYDLTSSVRTLFRDIQNIGKLVIIAGFDVSDRIVYEIGCQILEIGSSFDEFDFDMGGLKGYAVTETPAPPNKTQEEVFVQNFSELLQASDELEAVDSLLVDVLDLVRYWTASMEY